MIDFKNHYENNKTCFFKTLEFIDSLYNDTLYEKLNVYVGTTLKSSIYLLIYNIIEWTFITSLNTIHDSINDENIYFESLSPDLKKLLDMYHSKKNLKKEHKSHYESIKTNNEKITILDFKTYNQVAKIVSGNIDKKKFKDVLSLYGVELATIKHGKELEKIKKIRNLLSHGESSFIDIGKNICTSDIKPEVEDAIHFLDEYVDTIVDYISQKNFLCKN